MGRLSERSSASIESLLRVARSAFGEHGYADASLEAIAAAAGLTKGAVYHHFGSKQALFERVFQGEHRRMIDVVAGAGRGATDPLQALALGVEAYFDALLDGVVRRIVLVDGPAVLGWVRWRRCEEPGFTQLLEAALAAAAALGILREGLRPAETALLLLGATTEAALAVAHSDEPDVTAARLAEEFRRHVDALRV